MIKKNIYILYKAGEHNESSEFLKTSRDASSSSMFRYIRAGTVSGRRFP